MTKFNHSYVSNSRVCKSIYRVFHCIAVMLIVSILLLILSFSDGSPATDYTVVELSEATQKLNALGNKTNVTVELNGQAKTLTLSPAIYLTYDKVVYESPNGDFKTLAQGLKTLGTFKPKWKNNKGEEGEYRYLGVDQQGNAIFNEDFPKDFVSGKRLEDKDWDYHKDNRQAWEKLYFSNPAIIAYILHKPVIDDGVQTEYTLMDILKNKTTDEAEALYYIQLQSLPTFYADGVVKLTHQNGAFYDSFNIPKFKIDLEAVLTYSGLNPTILDAAVSEHSVSLILDGSKSFCREDSDAPKDLPIEHYIFELTKSSNPDFNPAVSEVLQMECMTLEEAKAVPFTLSGVRPGEDLLARLTVHYKILEDSTMADATLLNIDLLTTAPPIAIGGEVKVISFNGIFDVIKGIPTYERLKIEATVDDRAQSFQTQHLSGIKTYDVTASRTYTRQWTETDYCGGCRDTNGDGVDDSCPGHKDHFSETETVTQTVQIQRPYSYYQIQQLTLSALNWINVRNAALPAGNQSLFESDFTFTKPTGSVWHSVLEDEHIKAPVLSVTLSPKTVGKTIPSEDFTSEADAIVGPISVRNDALTIDGSMVMDGGYYPQSAPAPQNLPIARKLTIDSNLAQRSTLLADGIDPKIGYIIPVSTLNATYPSSAVLSYTPILTVGLQSPKQPTLSANSVVVHTPVICNISLYPNDALDQRVNKAKDQVALILDTPFTLSYVTTGQHRAIPGYGNREYKAYAKNKSLKFPFDVYRGKDKTELILANTWIDLDLNEEDFDFYLPHWVKEGTYTLSFKTKPENFPEGRTMKGQVYANLGLNTYNAYQQAQVEVTGRLYDLRIIGSSDTLWQSLFMDPETKTPTGTVLFTGTKDKNKNPAVHHLNTLPLMPGKHTGAGHQNLGLKLGYAFLFDIKSMGSYYGLKDALRITPTFYHLDENGQNRQEVDLYYHHGDNYYIKIGSERDKVDRFLILKNPLLMATQIFKEQTAEDNEVVGIETRTQTLTDYMKETYIGRAFKIVLSKGLRYCIGGSIPCLHPDEAVQRQARLNVQKWFGYYYLPSSTLALPKGTDITQFKGNLQQNAEHFLTKGYIVVNFTTIELNQNGDYSKPILKYVTDTANEWRTEGYQEGQNGFDIRFGDVCLYLAGQRATEDYGAGVSH